MSAVGGELGTPAGTCGAGTSPSACGRAVNLVESQRAGPATGSGAGAGVATAGSVWDGGGARNDESGTAGSVARHCAAGSAWDGGGARNDESGTAASGNGAPVRRASRVAISSETSSSVSRQAVPLPMAMTWTWCLRTSSSSRKRASALLVLGLVRKDNAVFLEDAGLVEDGHLAAGAEAGVDGQHAFAAATARPGACCASCERRPRRRGPRHDASVRGGSRVRGWARASGSRRRR